jgi:hypothetical protein
MVTRLTVEKYQKYVPLRKEVTACVKNVHDPRLRNAKKKIDAYFSMQVIENL